MTSFDKHRYLIVGGGSGIGAETAAMLKGKNAEVFIAGRDTQKLQRIADDLKVEAHTVDASDFVALETLGKLLTDKYGPLSGLINCAGSILLKPAHLTSYSEYMQTIQLNLTTAFSCVRVAGKVMAQQGGSVVLMSSAAARHGLANHEAIAAAKGGIISLTQSAAATYSPNNIRFNAIAPGLVDTPLSAGVVNNPMSLKISEQMHALGRIGTSKQIANMITWLVNPENNWVTGQVFGIDGGLGTVATKVKV